MGKGISSALIYALAQNCKVCGVDFESYFEEVILRVHHEAPATLTPAAIPSERAAAGEAIVA